MNPSSVVSALHPDLHLTQHQAAYSGWLDEKEAEALKRRVEARRMRIQQGVPLVVVVNEDIIVAIILSEILRRKGYNAVWFSESTEALAYVHSGEIDLLLSDVTMQHLNGIGLVSEVHDALPNCRLLLISAVKDCPAIAERVAGLGVHVHIEAKPFQVGKLVSSLATLLDLGPGLNRSAACLKHLDV